MLATGAGFLGSIIALFWNPSALIRSAVQHFAAGAVLAAIASNVIPEVERMGTFAGIIGGFIAGGLLMIGLKWIVVRLEHGRRVGGKVASSATAMLFTGFLVLLALKLLG